MFYSIIIESRPTRYDWTLIFLQAVCGISVVDGSTFEDLKRYNIHEIYQNAATGIATEAESEG